MLDDKSEVIKTQSQVESLTLMAQMLAVGTQVDVGPRERVAAVEPTLLVEDNARLQADKSVSGRAGTHQIYLD